MYCGYIAHCCYYCCFIIRRLCDALLDLQKAKYTPYHTHFQLFVFNNKTLLLKTLARKVYANVHDTPLS